MANVVVRMGKALGGLALSCLCLLPIFQADAAQAQSPSANFHSDIEGVWEPGGGPLFDPAARAMPVNKGQTLMGLRDVPPYNAEYQARYDKVLSDLSKGLPVKDLSAKCLPQGMPRMMAIGYPIEIVVKPKRVYMLFETLSQRRIVFMDGRKHKNAADLDPSFSGESIGHWEGDVLVVDTIGLRDDIVFDYTVAPHSDALHIVERIRRVGDTLEDQMTLDDAKAFTKEWRVTRVFNLRPDWELNEYVCENNRDN